MNDGTVPDRDISSDQHWLIRIPMQHSTVLNVAAGTDPDRSKIPPRHGRGPEAAALLHGYVSDHHCCWGNPGTGMDLG